MKGTSGSEKAKENASLSAVELVEDGDVVGLGTGSTAAYAIRELGRRVDEGLDIAGIPTSYASRQLAVEEGIPLTSLDVETPDIDIDGADAFDSELNLVKGGGAAHSREKVVAEASDRVVIVVDSSKFSDGLDHPIPVEVLDFAVSNVREKAVELGGEPELRASGSKDGPVVTDNGNLVVDIDFGEIYDPASLGGVLSQVAGVVEHGIFAGVADEVHVGNDDGVEVRM